MKSARQQALEVLDCSRYDSPEEKIARKALRGDKKAQAECARLLEQWALQKENFLCGLYQKD